MTNVPFEADAAPGTSKTLPVGILTISKAPISFPIPLTETVVRVPFASTGRLNTADALPTSSGMNVTLIEQLTPGPTLASQLVQKGKDPGLAPVTRILLVGIGRPVVLRIRIVFVALRVKTFVSAKVMVSGAGGGTSLTLNGSPAILRLPDRKIVAGSTENAMVADPVPDWLLVIVNHE